MKIKLKEGLYIFDDNGDEYILEDGDYTIINSKVVPLLLNADLVRNLSTKELQEKALFLIGIYGEHEFFNMILSLTQCFLPIEDAIEFMYKELEGNMIRVKDNQKIIDIENNAYITEIDDVIIQNF